MKFILTEKWGQIYILHYQSSREAYQMFFRYLTKCLKLKVFPLFWQILFDGKCGIYFDYVNLYLMWLSLALVAVFIVSNPKNAIIFFFFFFFILKWNSVCSKIQNERDITTKFNTVIINWSVMLATILFLSFIKKNEYLSILFLL